MGIVRLAQLFNTSWTAHTLSPLHHSKEHHTLVDNQNALKIYAKRLRDQLTGDFIRGAQVTLMRNALDDALSKAGPLIDCKWEFISRNDGDIENPAENEDEDEDGNQLAIEAEDCIGIFVTLEYENIVYRAALLTNPEGYKASSLSLSDQSSTSSTHLPLLLTRMPTALRTTFIEFLSATFDTYCSTLHLPPVFLATILKATIAFLIRSENLRPTSNGILEKVLKDMQLTLTFSQSIAPALKGLDISIPRETLSVFSRGGVDDNNASHFSKFFSQYLNHHLGMKVNLETISQDLDNNQKQPQHVWLSKIATAIFVVSAEGRFKLIETLDDDDNDKVEEQQLVIRKLTRSANEQLLRSLVQRARGDEL